MWRAATLLWSPSKLWHESKPLSPFAGERRSPARRVAGFERLCAGRAAGALPKNMSKPRIAFLGLGIMGSDMARWLLACGYPLTVIKPFRKRKIGL
jgi:hypothetical protein